MPDWRYYDGLATLLDLARDTFRAAGNTSCGGTTVIVDHSLSVDAICLDHLQNIASPGPTQCIFGLKDVKGTELALKRKRNMLRETVEMTSSSPLYRSEEERWYASWLTLIGGKKLGREQATPDYEERVTWYKENIERILNDDADMEDDQFTEFDEISRLVGSMEGNRLFCLSLEGRTASCVAHLYLL